MVGVEMRDGESVEGWVARVVTMVMLAALSLLCALTLAGSAGAAVPGSFGVGDFSEPHGIAVGQETGDVYVADRNDSRVMEFSGEGLFVRAWGWGVVNGAAEFQVCTATDPSSCRAGLTGTGAGEFGGDPAHGDFGAEAIAVDNTTGILSDLSHGDVYVTDKVNDRVEKYSAEGQYLSSFGSAGSGDGQFEEPKAIAVDPEGHVYVGDRSRVQRFSEAGVFEATVVSGVGVVDGLASAANGDIYVQSSGQTGVREYEPDGTEVTPVRDETGQPRIGLAVDGAGDLFVNDEEAGTAVHRIFEYEAAGTQIESFDRAPSAENANAGMAWGESLKALYLLTEHPPSYVRVVGLPAPGPLVFEEGVVVRPLPQKKAQVEAEIDPENAETKYFVEYGATSALGRSTGVQQLPASFAESKVTVELTGLEFATEYHYCVVAENENGPPTPCVQRTFTALPATVIASEWVEDVAAASGTFAAQVNPEAAATSCSFEYGTQAQYNATGAFERAVAASPIIAPEAEPITVSAHVQEGAGLLPGTEYAYRISCIKEGSQDIGAVQSFRTQSEHAGVALPDQRVLERVAASSGGAEISSPQKEGLPQIAENGSTIAYLRVAPGAVSTEGNFSTVELAQHGSSGWASSDIATPYTSAPGNETGKGTEYRLFSNDLSASIVAPWDANPLAPGVTDRTPYRRTEPAGGAVFEPLLTTADVSTGAAFGGPEVVQVEGASANMAHVVLKSQVPLTSGGVSGGLYEWSGGALANVSVPPGGETMLPAVPGGNFGIALNTRGMVSGDGSLVYWTPQSSTGVNGLFVRDTQSGESLRLDVPVGVTPMGGEVEAPVFQIATEDGSRVFFTDSQRLTLDSTATAGEPDLYECRITTPPSGPLGCALSDVTTQVAKAGEHAGVQGLVSGMNEAGTRLYFVASGVLAQGATAGERNLYTAVEGKDGSWQTSFIASLSAADSPYWGASALAGLSTHTSASGRWFAFMSNRSLTGYDTRDAETGRPDEEVYLYDAQTGHLVCASCDPSGARPHGVADVAGSLPSWQSVTDQDGLTAYQPDALSDGGRVFFDGASGLSVGASNGAFGVYEFEPVGVGSCVVGGSGYSGVSGGCMGLVSPGGAQGDAVFLGASADGDDAFVMSTAGGSTAEGGAPLYSIFDVHSCEAGSGWGCPPAVGVGVTGCESAVECKSLGGGLLLSGGLPASAGLEGKGNLPLAGAAKSGGKAGSKGGKGGKKGAGAREARLKRALARCRSLFARSVRRRKRCERVARRRYRARTADHHRRRGALFALVPESVKVEEDEGDHGARG